MNRKLLSIITIIMSIALVSGVFGIQLPVEAAPKKTKKVTKVEITKPASSTLVLKKGGTYTLKYKITPKNASNKKVKFSSSNKKVVTVSTKGKIKAVGRGTAKITVKSVSNGKKKASITVKVGTPVKKVLLSKKTVKLTEGGSTTIKATISPKSATNKKVIYRTSNKQVASVSNKGKITALKQGTAKITAEATDGSGKKATCIVTVQKKAVTPSPSPTPEPEPIPVPEPDPEYHLVWSDDFLESELNIADWNYEMRAPGWVNNELQEYTDSIENVYVKDGNLVLKARKTTVSENGVSKDYYTSGKVTTQNKHDFKYGKFEIRAKAPKGQGLWPAIWMMPTDESFYGQWPKCGEIDIMELLGHEPNVVYGTIHYGEPHREQQRKFVLEGETFADDYHTYAVEWEPGEIRFYIDGILYHTANDWFTKVEGKGEVTYPAPFDQPFYLQMNLAVGGNWPGKPDATTDFENAEFKVDYVKVYQKDSYDEDVTKPEKNIDLREPDSSGNYIVNGDFSVMESLEDDVDWGVKYALGGQGNSEISNHELIIRTTDYGTKDYSVQVVQPDLPMKQGGKYTLTFDAYAEDARNMIVDISGPDNGYIRYLTDTVVSLGTQNKSYKYEFIMTEGSDSNGRLEFNLGNQNSIAAVHLSNIRLEKTGETEIREPEKSVLPDGNYVYNGEFQEGDGRLKYWNVEKSDKVQVSVTNDNGRRELMVQAPTSVSLNDVLVKQEKIAISEEKNYVLTFDAYGDSNKTIVAQINGETFQAEIGAEKKQFKYELSTGNQIIDNTLVFNLGVPGITYIDNVRIAEDRMLINGDFSSGFTGWEPFVDSTLAARVTYVVDSLTENDAAAFGIQDTGKEAWQIQLKQNNIKLEEGKWYQLAFYAKTNRINGRKIMAALQRDGSKDNNWDAYSEKIVAIGSEYQRHEITFQMKKSTDEKTIMTFSMGAVAGEQITDKHDVYIDDVSLEEIAAPELPSVSGNMIQNSDFTKGNEGLENWIMAVSSPGKATAEAMDGGIKFDIENVGTYDWDIQLKQGGIHLQKGHKYKLEMKVVSDTTRHMKAAFLTSSYNWYGGIDFALEKDVEQDVSTIIYIGEDKESDSNIDFVISMGRNADDKCPEESVSENGICTHITQPGSIYIKNISVEEIME